MRRRKFVTLLSGTAAAWPIAAQSQHIYKLGVLSGRARQERNFQSFFDELRQFGFVEGQQLVVDQRGFGAREDRFPALAMELVASRVDAILAAGDAAIKAAQAATRSVPIVAISDDMVGSGLVRSLARSGTNITGVSILSTELNAKRLGLLVEALNKVRRIAVLSDPRITTPEHLKVLRSATQFHEIELVVCEAATPEEIVPAIEIASKEDAQGVNVLAAPLFSFNSQRIIDCMAVLRLPAIYQWPEIAEDGGFLAYGPRITRMYQQMARQLIKLIQGAKVAELPIEQPTVLEFIVNLRTAKARGFDVSPTLLAHADEVIE